MQLRASARTFGQGVSRPISRCRPLPVTRTLLVVRAAAAPAVVKEAPAKEAFSSEESEPRKSTAPQVFLPQQAKGKTIDDKKPLGRMLYLLRQHPRNMAFVQCPSTDRMAVFRCTRMVTLASRIIKGEQPNKAVQLNVASRQGPPLKQAKTPAKQAAADGKGGKTDKPVSGQGAKPAPARQSLLRFSAVLVDAPPVVEIKDESAKQPFRVSNKTVAVKLGTAAAAQLNKHGETRIVAVGAPAVRTAIEALNFVRVRSRKNEGKDVAAYVADYKVGGEKEGSSMGNGTEFVLRYAPLAPRRSGNGKTAANSA